MSSRSTPRWLIALIPLALVLALAIPASRVALFAMRPHQTEPPVETHLMVQRGISPLEVSKQLADAGIIEDARQFHLLGRLTRQWKSLKMGEYAVSSTMTPLEIFQTLASGNSVKHKITIREGENMYEIADAIQAEGLSTREKILALCKSPEFIQSLGFTAPLPPTLEGYLFPETYLFTRLETPENLLQQMVHQYRQAWTESLERLKSAGIPRPNMSEHQIVTLASMIEKETGAPEERPLISSVFHNRLKKKMRLQSDPTTIYGIWEKYSGNIHKQDLLTPTPFNTYTVPALPVGPISNPGSMALEAAMNPAVSEYLFFVSQNDGRHVFTVKFSDHTAAVKKFQMDPRAREGKSWRDLSKGKTEHR